MSKTKNEKYDLKYYLNLPYTIKLIPEEAGGFFAKIEELPGCMAQGETVAETLKDLEKSKKMWLESMLKKKKTIPMPEAMKEYSGKFVVRIPAYLHRRLASLAKKEGVSLNQMALSLLSEKITIEEIKSEIQTAFWEIGRKTDADYILKYSSMKVAQPDAVYDTLSKKSKIPKVEWSKPDVFKS